MTSGSVRFALSSRLGKPGRSFTRVAASLSQSRVAGKRARQTGRSRDRLSGSEGVNMSRSRWKARPLLLHPLRVALNQFFVTEAFESLGFFSLMTVSAVAAALLSGVSRQNSN